MEIDFEFNESNEPNPNLVCCSLTFKGSIDLVEEYWLLNDKEEQRRLSARITELQKTHYNIAHASTAESRCYIALGVDPTKFQWIDTYLERRQLINKCDEFKYGTHFGKDGTKKHSVRPSFNPWKNAGKDNTELHANFAHSVGRHLGICVDTEHKDEMRNVILSCDDELITKNRKDIQDYCTSDILPLYDLACQMNRDLESVTALTPLQIEKAALRRGRFAADTAWMEHNGIPLDMIKLKNLQNNYDLAKDELIEDLVNNYYPFFVREVDTKFKSNIKGVWKFKQEAFNNFVESNNLQRDWPRTDPSSKHPYGQYRSNDDTLAEYLNIPAIRELAECKKQIGQLKWFRVLSEADKLKDGEFMDAVGSDNMLRCFFNIYGTQTSRNAPPAKKFILAMSSWLRCLIRPPKGEVIVAKDWGSQEFAVAAVMGNDQQMCNAYFSNDPYLYLAKLAGAVPRDADPKLCKNPSLIIPEDLPERPEGFDRWHMGESSTKWLLDTYPEIGYKYVEYLGHEKQRGLFKSTCLGLQYGMKSKSLSKKLTLDTGTEVSEKEAKRLETIHKKQFRVFWTWVECQYKKYKRNKHLTLWDGWALLGDNDNELSVKNFPVQGTSAAIMRLAVQKATDYGVKIMCPLHDAIYARCYDNEADIEWTCEMLDKAMDEAVSEVLGDRLKIRIDTDIHTHDDVWIEGKGKSNYERLSKFLEHQEGSLDTKRTKRKEFFNVINNH